MIQHILQFCRDNLSSTLQFKYVAFMYLLDVYIPGKERAHQPRYTNKTTPERSKLICKVITKASYIITKIWEQQNQFLFNHPLSFPQN